MIKRVSASFILCLSFMLSAASAEVDLGYYLPDAIAYNAEVPKPKAALGYEVGEWHVRPEQIVQYFNQLASSSDRVKVEVIGYSYEQRPLILAYISSPENLENLEQLRQAHLNNEEDSKIFTWMGYSVHGNESSGSNASLLFAYHYAAAKDAKTLKQLDDQVIIIDPSLNPDGLARFAHWANSNRSMYSNPDSNDREHNEEWPSARTNHYWFDLNRDWLLLRHPESRARVSQFHRWRPHVLTDFHEMGTDSTYFFQPGVHSRQNPLTSENNYKMTAQIAEYHAKALDDIGSLYYSKESFDDFYYGKGSTYPDAHGTVGILFEQASARGHRQSSDYGEVSFPFAINNHLTTSFSTIEATQAKQAELRKLRQSHLDSAKKNAKSDKQKAVVIKSVDEYRMQELATLLGQHRIKFYALAESIEVKGTRFAPTQSMIIPFNQEQYLLIKSLFEHRKQFKDQIFYDVSAWNMGDAFDLDYQFLSRSQFDSDLLKSWSKPAVKPQPVEDSTVAIAVNWQNTAAAQLLVQMQAKGIRVQGATKPVKFKSKTDEVKLSAGSLLVPLKAQSMNREALIAWLQQQAQTLNLNLHQITSGLAIEGYDLGSPSAPIMKKVKPLLLTGQGTSSYGAGEIWYWLDQILKQPVTLINSKQLGKINLTEYTHLLMPSGSYDFKATTEERIDAWVKQGGIIVAHSGAAEWVTKQGWTSSELSEFEKPVNTKVRYEDKSQIDAKHIVGGAIANAEIDTSHPLGFGLDNNSIAIFKRGLRSFTEPKEAFVAIARFDDKPHLAGYMSEAFSQHIAEKSSIIVQGYGKGKVIAFSDNPLFRGFWLGTAKVFTNALYFGHTISSPKKTEEKDSKEQGASDKPKTTAAN